ncbi:MAG: MBL fold metallo-hydrolase [Anaerolineaceae bacterium]
MQEIAPNVFIENNSLGLVTGVIRGKTGSVLIDSPSRQDEMRSWRSGTARLITGDPKFLVHLDTNYDRLLGIKGTDCVIVTHTNSLVPEKVKTSGSKPADESMQPGEGHEAFVSPFRVIPPEIVFSQSLALYLDDTEILLEHHPGSNFAGIWAELPARKVIFVGDAVLPEQPPFLAYCDLDHWLEDLSVLSGKKYRNYQIVSARSGVLDQSQVELMAGHIETIHTLLSPLMARNASLEELLALIPAIMQRFEPNANTSDMYYNRLRWGLTTYYELNHA